MKTTNGIIHGIADPNPDHRPDPVNLRDQLHAMADDFDRSTEQLATACTVQGILHGARLDTAVCTIAAHIDKLDAEAIDELADAIRRYTGKSTLEPDPTPHRESSTPHLGVTWPRCPECHYDGRDKTFTDTNRRHTLPDGSPAVYAKCRQCRVAVVIEHWGDE